MWPDCQWAAYQWAEYQWPTIAAAPPDITSIDPSTGSTAGGTSVTIEGTGFNGSSVTIGGTAATSVVVVSSTEITCVTPAHAAGSVDVVVTNADTQSDTLAGGFTYVASGGTTTRRNRSIMLLGG